MLDQLYKEPVEDICKVANLPMKNNKYNETVENQFNG